MVERSNISLEASLSLWNYSFVKLLVKVFIPSVCFSPSKQESRLRSRRWIFPIKPLQLPRSLSFEPRGGSTCNIIQPDNWKEPTKCWGNIGNVNGKFPLDRIGSVIYNCNLWAKTLSHDPINGEVHRAQLRNARNFVIYINRSDYPFKITAQFRSF